MRAGIVENKGIKQSIERAQRRAPEWVMPMAKALLLVLDFITAVFSFLISFSIRDGFPILSSTAWAWSEEFKPYAGVLFFIPAIRLAMLFYQRMYLLQGSFSYIEQFLRIFKAITVGSLLIIAVTFLFRGGFQFRDFSYSRGVFILDYVLALGLYSLIHLGFRYLQTLARRKGLNLIPTLIVGSGAESERTIKELGERPDLGYRVVGVVINDITPDSSVIDYPQLALSGVPVVGRFSELHELVHKIRIQEVIITDSNISNELLFDAMMKLGRAQHIEFRLAPSLFNVLPQKTSVEQIGVLPMVRLFREPLTEAERLLKRAFDVLVSLFAILVTAPFGLLIAYLIKMDSPGSILFKQERVGMDGRVFLCYKFRTMAEDADDKLHRESYEKNIKGVDDANTGDDLKPVFGKVKDDPRITRVGKFLRRFSLDELPQFLNVLKGDMSMVGPRPPIPYEVESYELRHRKRLDIKPGITGLWQVSGRNRVVFDEMVKIDLFYIENWSLWLDLKIILFTLPAVFRGDGTN